MTASSQPDVLASARAAMDRHDWRTAYDVLSKADASDPLAPDALELLADAAWWTGQLPVAIEVRERAYAAATRNGDTQTAIIVAIRLAHDNLKRMSMPLARAWLKRAESMLEGLPENPGHGWLAVTRAFHDALVGDTDGALAQASRAVDIAGRFEDPDLAALALGSKAAILVSRGQVDEGLAMADEATLSAISGDLDPQTAGGVCCATIEACAVIGDVERANEWTEAQDRWCRREGINGFPGMCRLFRSGVKTLRGNWPEVRAMPLCTTTTFPVVSECGWAFTSVGAPWVAQRVWPTPRWPVAGWLIRRF